MQPLMVDIGDPDEDTEVQPLYDPVRRTNPLPIPAEPEPVEVPEVVPA